MNNIIQYNNASKIKKESVNKEYGIVDGYTLILKHIDAQKLNIENSLKNMEDRMNEEIKTA